MKRSGAALALLLLLAPALALAQRPALSPEQQAREKQAAEKLDAVRAEIRALTQARRAIEGERDEVSRTLREADQAVDREARALREIDAGMLVQEQELAALEVQKAALEQRLSTQREALAQLLRAAYALGRHEQLKLLLAQDRIDGLARVLAYHRYFQRDRVGRIEGLLQELQQLARIGEAVRMARTALALSKTEQTTRVAELEAQRDARRGTLAAIESRFQDAQARLTALGRDERALVQLLDSLRDVFADIPQQIDDAQPFAQRKGRLQLPLPGKVRSGFGAALPDGRASQGWLIGGESGAAVAAVAPGRVAFADWLKGYGLLVILDHGDGYMSLYAHNDSLMKEAGDWVARGEALAGVGTSGGQATPALYFELRLNGRPVDPRGWFGAR